MTSRGKQDKPDELSRAEYKQIADVIMNYCVEELGADRITMLPFVAGLTIRLTPTLLRMLARPKQEVNKKGKKL